MCQQFEDQNFPDDQCMKLENHAWVTCRPVNFNIFTDVVLDSKLLVTFKKLLLVEIWCHSKEKKIPIII